MRCTYALSGSRLSWTWMPMQSAQGSTPENVAGRLPSADAAMAGPQHARSSAQPSAGPVAYRRRPLMRAPSGSVHSAHLAFEFRRPVQHQVAVGHVAFVVVLHA